ncbi:hydrogenase expression/formation protein HypE [Candidatus Parabeggiatoa sp. HSG14]|uniref:hydrogenase expression/formation protein HypE n=1 Tax=Candidatus Parabeggiatoa sp. HSG14 TaxID=3055593 RepID=UPI0025A6DE9D|nr:hydrogenase expression/formation protein HypE [Thiotrichales bacterium HSG14]
MTTAEKRLKNLQSQYIQLAHGNGGRFMRELIDNLFAYHLNNSLLDTNTDATAIPIDGTQEVMVTTDGFTVKPLEFPGGNIGSLAVHGTVNDLCVSGAVPQYLTLNAFIEEGLEITQLDRIIASLGTAAKEANVSVVAGDTKVVARGEGGGLYLATTGVGLRDKSIKLGTSQICPSDIILVSGPIGDHGIAVMLAREQFGMRGDLQSDSANVLPLSQALLKIPGLKFMRDPTRGGLASVLHEICQSTGLNIRVFESQIPIREPVRSVCEMLGYDPYYLACEGRVVAVVSEKQADTALAALQTLADGKQAAKIGILSEGQPHLILETELGGERFLELLEDDPLPRIC